MAAIYLKANPRMHIGLVDLGHASQRRFCGLGFSVDGAHTIWRARSATELVIDGIHQLDSIAQIQIKTIANKIKGICKDGFHVQLDSCAPQHVGFGTKTTLTLGLIAAINTLKELKLSTSEINQLSGRGGTSGAGLHLFSVGGVVWDGGHSDDRTGRLLPSSAATPMQAPPILGRWEFPSRWRIALFLPKGNEIAGADEEEFFARNTPIPRQEVLETMAIMYHGVIPGFAAPNISSLGMSLRDLHKVGFKKRELFEQPAAVQQALHYLQANTELAVGMSSMGPLIYCIFETANDDARKFIVDACSVVAAKLVGIFQGCNEPHKVVRR